jgi:hypothetical protein
MSSQSMSSQSISSQGTSSQDASSQSLSPESTFVFSSGNIAYRNFAGSEFYPLIDEEGRINSTDYASTSVMVAHQPGTHIPVYRWEDREIWFYTNNDRQYLELEIVSPQQWQDRPRFDLHRIHSNSLRWIRAVEHRFDSRENWRMLKSVEEKLPEHTRFVRLTLILPGHGHPTSFKFSIYARDRQFDKPINCDPLVGNDPPRNDPH